MASCAGLTDDEGTAAPRDIIEEFLNRPWHLNPECTWNGSTLLLIVENDYDSNGSAVLDEFSDAVHACVNCSGSIMITIVSVTEFAP